MLTLDTSLPNAAEKLQSSGDVPFCMTLDGFLNIISPYVRADYQQSYAEMFVELVSRNIFPPEDIIELEDFLMFTEFDISVRNMPGEDVKKVIRRVKNNLRGGIDLKNERKKIVYEVQKALADPTLKYRTKLEEDLKRSKELIERLTKEWELERRKIELENQQKETSYKGQLEGLGSEVRLIKDKSEKDGIRIERIIKISKLGWYLFRVTAFFILFALIGVGIWSIPENLLESFQRPLLCKVSISFFALFCWVAIIMKIRLISVILFVCAVLSLLFSAWMALIG